MSIHAVPDDVLVDMARFLTHEKHISAFACTSHRFNGVAKRAIHPTALLLRACRHGRVTEVARLLRGGRADPTARNHYTMRAAAEFGHKRVAKLLLEDGRADVAAIDNGIAIRMCAAERCGILKSICRYLKRRPAYVRKRPNRREVAGWADRYQYHACTTCRMGLRKKASARMAGRGNADKTS